MDFKEALKPFTVFSLQEIKKIDADFQRRRLNEWQDKGYIKKVIKGFYIFSDLKINEKVLGEIANRIYAPSYVSLEMALSYYSFIPESVYAITSTATRKTSRFSTPIGEFIYRTIKPALFFGYNLVAYNDQKIFKIASPEKAILDYLYINPHIKSEDELSSLRLNVDLFWQTIDENQLGNYLEKFGQLALSQRVQRLMEFMKNA